MVLQVPADTGQVHHHRDAYTLQDGPRTQSGDLQEYRRGDGAGCEYDLLLAGHCALLGFLVGGELARSK